VGRFLTQLGIAIQLLVTRVSMFVVASRALLCRGVQMRISKLFAVDLDKMLSKICLGLFNL
jgi:hypothetical protein